MTCPGMTCRMEPESPAVAGRGSSTSVGRGLHRITESQTLSWRKKRKTKRSILKHRARTTFSLLFSCPISYLVFRGARVHSGVGDGVVDLLLLLSHGSSRQARKHHRRQNRAHQVGHHHFNVGEGDGWVTFGENGPTTLLALLLMEPKLDCHFFLKKKILPSSFLPSFFCLSALLLLFFSSFPFLRGRVTFFFGSRGREVESLGPTRRR